MKKSLAFILAFISSCIIFWIIMQIGINFMVAAIYESTFFHNLISNENVFINRFDSLLSLLIGFWIYKILRKLEI
jgi:hypothetical protein